MGKMVRVESGPIEKAKIATLGWGSLSFFNYVKEGRAPYASRLKQGRPGVDPGFAALMLAANLGDISPFAAVLMHTPAH